MHSNRGGGGEENIFLLLYLLYDVPITVVEEYPICINIFLLNEKRKWEKKNYVLWEAGAR